MPTSATHTPAAGLAFDALAGEYDEKFTTSLIGRAQRDVVWEVLDRTFSSGDKILELNCGTGEDALHLARHGVSVLGCDASARMLDVARCKFAVEQFRGSVSFHQLASEHINEISYRAPFDGAFSNFAGLNCVEDLGHVSDELAGLIRPGGYMLLCLCSRACLSEILYFGFRLKWKEALRRCRGHARIQVRGVQVAVQYPTLRQLKRIFSPWFALREVRAVGLAIPPSYLESWVSRHENLFRALVRIDRLLRSLPEFRVLGDHVLLTFQRCDV
jgi:ubiquinone/menaquinone biosynthesis C-methylase UbiE